MEKGKHQLEADEGCTLYTVNESLLITLFTGEAVLQVGSWEFRRGG